MEVSGRSSRIVGFGIFEADLQSGELRKNGHKVPLQGQPFQVFAILLQSPGKLVTREELREKVWPEDTFVDFDHAMNTSIAKIRVALGDDADNPRFVETLPRRGYRFIAPVEKPISPPPSASTSSENAARLRTRWKLLGVAAVLIAAVSGIGIWRFARNREGPPLPPMEVVPLPGMAGRAGYESTPAFSPDGKQVAFAFHARENSGIYTTIVEGERSLRLTNNRADWCPTWSPDGGQVAFSRFSGEGFSIYSVPAFGGTEHRLYHGPSSRSTGGLSWSPEGKVLAFAESDAEKTHTRIALLSLADYSVRRLTSPSGQEEDFAPAFSPDGSRVAFIRAIVAGVVSDLYVMPATGGAPERLTFDNTWILGGPTWTPDGREIVFSSARGGLASLWRVSASGGKPRPVVGAGPLAFCASVSPKGNQLVYERIFYKENIWRVNLKDETHSQGPPKAIVSEKALLWRPQVSPDGKRIAFESNRSGYNELWACGSDGSDCGQLTSLRGTSGAPRWSPDGRMIAFEYRPKEHSEIYLLDVDGGMPRLFATLPGADNGGPNWSRDGKWIYFYSYRGGGPFQLWKIQVQGGAPVQITKNGGVFAAESADGLFLYYSKYEAPGIWKMPLNGGAETHVLEKPEAGDWANWALARNGIYFFDSNSENDKGVKFFDFVGGKIIRISPLESRAGVGMAVSADGKTIFYDQNEFTESTVMLVKNFR
jgi:Tol biopolymer transport system component/DNA-binding winged helix-turn-helix (wHTH) protein